MTVRYWIAKYIEEPLRNEPRNVGVIVSTPNGSAARFIGENDDGVIDRRRLQRFKYADIYVQWIDYWRSQTEQRRFDELTKDNAGNYQVFLGGHVTDTGEDSPAAICDFLYSMLVSDQPIMQAFKLAEEVEFEQELPAEVTKVFDELELLAETAAVRARHPIKRFAAIAGAHTVHNPSFSQLNGTQRIYETIDFGIRKPKLIRERSGWMAYMFKDIREKTSDTTAYSIVRSEPDAGGEAIDYAGAILAGDSEVVDWRDAAQKSKFLNNVQRIAERLT